MKSIELKKTSERVKIARILSGLTLEQLSAITSISIPTLSRIENGLRTVNITELIKIANATKKPIPFFYEDDKETENSDMYKILEHFDPKEYQK